MHLQSRIEQPYGDSSDRGISPFASIEGDQIGVITRAPIGAAATFRYVRIKIVSNTGSGCTLTLQRNGVDTALQVVVGAGVTGWVQAPGEVTFDADDQWSWIVRASSPVTWSMIACEIEATELNITISTLGVNSQSEDRVSSGTTYFKLQGSRDNRGVAAEADLQLPVPGTITNFTCCTSTKTGAAFVTAGVRIDAAPSALSVQINQSSSNQVVDYGTAPYEAYQSVMYYGDHSSGTEIWYEKIGCAFLSTEGHWVSIVGDGYRDPEATGGSVIYYPIGGEMQRSTTEADAEVEITSATTVDFLFFRVVDPTIDLTYVTVRRNQTNTGLRLSSNGAGYFSIAGSELFSPGDTICFRVEVGASGGPLRMGHIGLAAFSSE